MATERIIIVGAGGFGRELFQWIKDILKYKYSDLLEYPEIHLLDDRPQLIKCSVIRKYFSGTIADFVFLKNDNLVVAIADPDVKEKVVNFLNLRTEGLSPTYMRIVHPTAIVAETAVIGVGTIICPNSLVSANAEIGDFVHINVASLVGHDAVVGDFCTISAQCDITGGAILAGKVFLGSGARILPGCSVAEGSRIGAGTVVSRSVKVKSTVFHTGSKKISLL